MQQKIYQHLKELQEIMQQQGLWQSIPPSAAALASQQPFALDTLTATEWLQWIFIPRMSALLEAKQPLPTAIAITPYLEEALKECDYLAKLLPPIQQIERLLTA